MLFGAGSLFLQSKELGADSLRGENLLHPLSIASFSLTFETSNIEAKALIDFKKQIVAAAIAEDIATLTLEFEYADWQTMQIAYDELKSDSSNITLPILKSKTATQGTSIAEVTDSDITGTEVVGSDIMVYVASKGPWGDRRYLTDAEVTLAAGKIELDETLVGAIIQYSVPKNYTSIETIGVSEQGGYDSLGKLYFQGTIAGTEFSKGLGIIVPEIYRISTPELTVNGELSTLSLEFRCGVPAGKRAPFELYNLETGTTV